MEGGSDPAEGCNIGCCAHILSSHSRQGFSLPVASSLLPEPWTIWRRHVKRHCFVSHTTLSTQHFRHGSEKPRSRKHASTLPRPPRKNLVAHLVADFVNVSLVALYSAMSSRVLHPPHAPQCMMRAPIVWAEETFLRVDTLRSPALPVTAAHTSRDA